MANDTAFAALGGFTDSDSGIAYRSASAGAFNAQTVGGAFAAMVAFKINVESLIPGQAAVARTLWGNLNASAFSGWGLSLSVASSQLVVRASLGDGSAVNAVSFPITGANKIQAAEQLIMAGLWFDGTDLHLTINGVIVATVDDAGPYAPSSFNVSLGINATTPPTESASGCEIFAAGYMNGLNFTSATTVARNAGPAFNALRASNCGSPAFSNYGPSWTHFYSAIANGIAGNLVKKPAGAYLQPLETAPQGLAEAPGTLIDLGNKTPFASDADSFVAVPYNPINLSRYAPDEDPHPGQPWVNGHKNLDWYQGANFTYA